VNPRSLGVAALVLVAAVAAWLAWTGFSRGEVTLAVAGASIPALKLTAGTGPLAAPFCALLAALDLCVACWCLQRGRAAEVPLIAIFSAAMLLVLAARSVALFFLAWEGMAFASVFLVAAHHERREVRRAALVYLVVSQTGAAAILVMLIVLALHAGDTSFGAIAAHAAGLDPVLRSAVIALGLAGFGSKAGLMPLHFWLPRAHPVAPAAASALMSGAMLNVAIYGLALEMLAFASPVPAHWAIAIVGIGVLSAVGGILYALVDRDLKRMLAYSSVENVGLICAGLGVSLFASAQGLPAAAALALAAALLHAVNHGLYKGLLFLGGGAVAASEGEVDLDRLGGAWKRLPLTAPLMLVGCASIAGLPPLNGFVSEWLSFQALVAVLAAGPVWERIALLLAVAALALAGGLSIACFVKLFGMTFLGVERDARTRPGTRERFSPGVAALALLALACVALGLYPALAFAPIAAIAASLCGAPVPSLPALAVLPLTLAIVPLACGAGALALARRGGVRSVATWTCGSPVTRTAQYSATAFSKPLRTVFAFVLSPVRHKTSIGGSSRWFPQRIVYRSETRYWIDDVFRRFAALTMIGARRSRLVQSGSLRLYLAYAIGAMIVVVAAAR
jgi:hydrogenase-4 component B